MSEEINFCKICGKEFFGRPVGSKVFCSEECKEYKKNRRKIKTGNNVNVKIGSYRLPKN